MTGLAEATPFTVLLKTRTLSANTFEAAMAASAVVVATNEQALAGSEFLKLGFMIWLLFDCVRFGLQAIRCTLQHLQADCDESV